LQVDGLPAIAKSSLTFMPAHSRLASFSGYDDVANLYDRSRPSYPDALIGDVLTFAQVAKGGKVLEIGCGTGQATTSFAPHDLQLVCLEPGPSLARIARERLRSFENVEVICQTFEAWAAAPSALDLIFSATAFHWVRRDVRFVKAARALRPGGTLAVFNAVPRPQALPIPDSVKRIIKSDPAISNTAQPWPFERQFSESRAFGTLEKRSYFTKRSYDVEGFAELLRTLNRFRKLPTHEQASVLGAARTAVESQGGSIALDFRIGLSMAHHEPKRPWWRRLSPRRSRSDAG
jgi:SAM-dependent methyltransferase